MKLIKRTYSYTAIWLLPVMIIGGFFCFFIIEYIDYEETDEFLNFEMERFVKNIRKNNDFHGSYLVADVIAGIKYDKPLFKDTLIFESGDNEMVPYRELHFSVKHDGRSYGIVLRHLLLPHSDILMGTFLIIACLIIPIALILYLMINSITGRMWKPFYQTLDKLVKFKIDNPLPVFPATSIDEFHVLNITLHSLLKKITDDYRHNKEFNENASHELQTHLAVIRANTEKLLNTGNISKSSYNELKKIYSASSRLSQIQKSLLLLSKINNGEFCKNVNLDLSLIMQQSLEIFSEAAQLRGIRIDQQLEPVTLFMDAGLAEILVNNLLKNAVKYNVDKGFIGIILNASSLIVKNSGLPYNGDPNNMLERFARGENGNLGIGLAIARQICELYRFSINYSISEETEHILCVSFNPQSKLF